MKTFTESPEIAQIAANVIKKEKLDVSRARISYLMVSPQIGKNVHGKCIKCNSELTYYADVDYIIEISKLTWDLLDEKARYLLVYHELLHIHIAYDEQKDDYKFLIRKHDIEDFREIVDRHGVDWLNLVKLYKNMEDDAGTSKAS